MIDRLGKPVYVNGKIPTVTGLALHLGMRTRTALLNFAKNYPDLEMREVAEIALSMIEEYAEMRLYDKNGSKGAMFSLCNSFRNWTILDRDESSKEQLEKLDSLIESVKATAKLNGTNTIMLEMVEKQS